MNLKYKHNHLIYFFNLSLMLLVVFSPSLVIAEGDCSRIFKIKPSISLPHYINRNSNEQDGNIEEESEVIKQLRKIQLSSNSGKQHIEAVQKSLIEAYQKSYKYFILGISNLSYSQASSTYTLMMFIKYLIAPSSVPEEFKNYVDSHLNPNLSIIYEERSYEILELNPNSDFVALAKEHLVLPPIKDHIRYSQLLSSLNTSFKTYAQKIDRTTPTDKNIKIILQDALKKYMQLKDNSWVLYSYAQHSSNIDIHSFSQFKIDEVLKCLNVFKTLFKLSILPYKFKLVDKLTSIISQLSSDDFTDLLRFLIAYPELMITTLTFNEEIPFVDDKNLLFTITLERFIDNTNQMLEKKLPRSDLKTVKQIYEVAIKNIDSYLNMVLEDIFLLDQSEKIEKHNVYSNEFIALVVSIHYWIYTHYPHEEYEDLDSINDDELSNHIKANTPGFAKEVVDIFSTLDPLNKTVFLWYMGVMPYVYDVGINTVQSEVVSAFNIGIFDLLFQKVINSNVVDEKVISEIMYLTANDVDMFLKFLLQCRAENEVDKKIIFTLIKESLTPPFLTSSLKYLRLSLTDNLITIDDILNYFYSDSFSKSDELKQNLIYILAKSTTTFNELESIITSLINHDLSAMIGTYFSYIDMDKFIQDNTDYLEQEANTISTKSKVLTQLIQLPKVPTNAKRLISFIFLKKGILSYTELSFILYYKKDISVSDSQIIDKVKSIELKDCLSFINKRTYLDIPAVKETLISNLIKMNTNEITTLSFDEIKSIVIFLISNTKFTGVEDKIVSILSQREDVTNDFINEINSSSLLSESLTTMKELMITHNFMKKAPKIKREVIKKVQINSIDHGTIRATEVELLVKDIIDNQDIESTINVVQLLNKLVTEIDTILDKNNGKRVVKELQKSLDLILKMLQNFPMNKYPLVKQVFYSNLSFDSFDYLISNITNYKLKEFIYSIFSYWIDSNIINHSNVDQFTDSLLQLSDKKIYSTQLLYKLVLKLLKISNKDNKSSGQLIRFLTATIKNDTKPTSSKDNPRFSFLNSSSIINELLPVISKLQELSEPLREVLKQKLSKTYSIEGVNQTNLYIIKLNHALINSVSSLPLYKKLILLSVLSDEAVLYLKNQEDLSKFNETVSSLKRLINYSKNHPQYIVDLASSVIQRLNEVLLLKDQIKRNLNVIYNQNEAEFVTEDSFHLREQTSIYILFLQEIKKGRICLNLSDRSFKGLGYDVVSVDSQSTHYTEVKSKMNVHSSDYPVSISLNEAHVALKFHLKQLDGNYHLVLVPLSQHDIMKYGEVIEMNINWAILQRILEYYQDPDLLDYGFTIIDKLDHQILLRDFTENLFRE